MTEVSAGSSAGLTLRLKGFKSFKDSVSVELRPLTVLAGPNSSGKSSLMQPLLMLKQTLESSYDPGTLLLDGPNVRFSDAEQILWQGKTKADVADSFELEVGGSRNRAEFTFCEADGRLVLKQQRSWTRPDAITQWADELQLFPNAPVTQALIDSLAKSSASFRRVLPRLNLATAAPELASIRTIQARFSLAIGLESGFPLFDPIAALRTRLQMLVHLPGLRGNPERSYRLAVGKDRYPGVFQDYFAGLIALWKDADAAKLRAIGEQLQALGLTWKVEARAIDATRVELRIGRLPKPGHGGARDLVNIADVGVGVSQVLPVLVALEAAVPGQIVHIEQPEIHLHPRAQLKLAELIVAAATKGAIVVVETHSHVLLLGLQACIARGEIEQSCVAFHWFSRTDQGSSKVDTAQIDSCGRFGTWPEDFTSVEMEAQDSWFNEVVKTPVDDATTHDSERSGG